MTDIKQDFKSYAGDAFQPVFTIYSDAANSIPLDLTALTDIIFTAQRDLESAAVLTKRMSSVPPGVAFVSTGVDGKCYINGKGADSAALTGFYTFQLQIGSNNASTVSTGRWHVGRAPAWTYSGDPANSDRDAVRYYISDTDSSNRQLYDSEIDYTLAQFGSPLLAAAQCARTLAGTYARKVNKKVGDLSISYSDIAKNYSALAASLQTQGEQAGVSFYAGGTSKADMEAVAANSDRPRQPFTRKQFNIPNAADSAQIPGEDCD